VTGADARPSGLGEFRCVEIQASAALTMVWKAVDCWCPVPP
jgi:hypothetical protein